MDLKNAIRRAPIHVRLLIVVRTVAIIAEAVILYCLDYLLDYHVPLLPVAIVIGAYVVVNAATILRLQHPFPVREPEMFAQLVVDVALLSALLYFTGGARNPLALYYLLLLLYASIALPPRLVWLLASACVLAYAALHSYHAALPVPVSTEIDLRVEYLTRFFVYALVGALIAWFGMRLSAIQRAQRERAYAEAEKDARERYLVGLAALSAGTAHALSTPLSTISVMVSELRCSNMPPPDWKESIDMLWAQVQLCRRSLSSMAVAADVERLGEVQRLTAHQFIGEVAAGLRALRPGLRLKLDVDIEDDLALQSDPTLAQALINFLNNAADVSPGSVELRARQDRLNSLKLLIEVLDRGPGIAPAVRQRLGKARFTTKRPGVGNGVGILIAQAAIERFGGGLAICDRRSGGTCVRIELPCVRLSAEKRDDDDYARTLGAASA